MVAQLTKQNNATFARGGMTLLGRQIAADSPGINRLAGDLILRAVARGIDQIADLTKDDDRFAGLEGGGLRARNLIIHHPSPPQSAQLENAVHGNRHVLGKSIRAHRGTSVHAALTEDLEHEVGETVNDGGLTGEIRAAVDQTEHLDYAGYAIQIANIIGDDGKRIETALSGGLITLLQRQICADAANEQRFACFIHRKLGG